MTTKQQRLDRRAELRADMHHRLADQRQRPLPGWLASRGNRRALVLFPMMALAAGLLAGIVRSDLVQAGLMAASVLLAAVGSLLLRRTTHLLDAVPDQLLDEREISERNAAYRRAYQICGLQFAVLVLLAVADSVLAKTASYELVRVDGWPQILITAMLTATMVPAAVVAWQWTDHSDETDD